MKRFIDDKRIILEDLNFQWKVKEIKKVQKLWNEGVGLKEIIEKVDREGDEIFLLLLHLSRKGRIKKRDGYIWGIYD